MSERFFRVFTGLLTSEHKKRIGSSLWTFLWLIDRITDETVDEDTGQRTGLVLYGNITPYSTIGNDLGMSKSTVKEQCEKLQSEGYISMEQTPRGNKFHVNRSKKWKDPLKDRAGNRTNRSDNQTKRAENGTTEKDDRAENRTEGAENRTKRSETPLSNTNIDILKEKDITTTTQERKSVENIILEMNNDDHLTDFERLENRYIELRGKGIQISMADIQAIQETLEHVPYDAAAFFLAKCFENRKGTSINSFRYCQKYIASEYQREVDRQKAIQEEQQNKVVPIHSPAVIYDDSTDEYKLADLLLRLIIKDQSDFTKPDIQKWASTFNAMLVEGKEAIHIQEVIVFARKSSFWKSKVLSPAELKRFYDRLRAQVQAEQAPNAGKRNHRVADMPKWMLEEQDQKSSDVESNSNSNDDGQAELKALLAERQRRKQERGLKNGSY